MQRELVAEFNIWGFDRRGWADSTRYAYTRRALYCDRWLRIHRRLPLPKAQPDHLAGWLSQLPANARTRNHARSALVGFFDFLIDRGTRSHNPARDIPTLRQPRLLPKALNADQAAAVVDAAATYGPRVEAAVHLMLHNSLRLGEVRRLRWDHLEPDGDGRTWIRFQAKGGHERCLPLHDLAGAALERWRPDCPSLSWVFPSPVQSGPLSATAIYNDIRRVGDRAGIRGLHPHRLRHTHATQLAAAGVDLSVIQDILGHSSPATTRIYTQVHPTRLVAAMGRVRFG